MYDAWSNPLAKVYQNTPGGFTDIGASLTGAVTSSVAWGDYDNDGDLDILLTGDDGGGVPIAKVYQNTGGVFSDIGAGLTGVSGSTAAWGDYDNDGDLDILLSGYGAGYNQQVAKIYRNDGSVFNTVPAPPTNLSQSISGNSVTLSWNASTDTQTPSAGLTYNLMVGTTSNGIDANSPMAEVSTGYRRVAQLGGTNHNESWTLNNLSEGCYFWRVQAVDHAFAGSPFSSEGTFTIGTPLAANAGSDQTINAGQSIQIGDSPVASGGTPPYSYSWSPASGLDDAAAENPNASPASTTTYTLTVTDANGCTATDEVTVEVISVKPFVFVANGLIEINRNKTSEGDIQSNYGDVQFDKGTPGTHTGNLFAGADIKIDKQNTIAGNATAGGEIHLSSGATITGSENPHTGIVVEALPNPSYSAGGPNETVKKNKSLTLPPGSYGNVVVCKNATLQLGHDGVSGEYFFNMLAAGEKSILAIDVSQGEVEINVVNKLDFGKQAEVDLSSGDAGSDDVTFTTLQESRLTIGEKARMLGNIIASDAAVTLAKNSRFKGKLWAQEIVVKQGAVFLPHGSSTPLPSITNTPDIEDIEAEQEITDAASLRITDYALAQNYPNPFNPSTKIGFLLPDAGNVTLKLYTITGQLVRTLASGNFSGGRHELVWDAKDDRGVQVSTGIYFYQIVVQRQNGDAPFMQTRRMILMK